MIQYYLQCKVEFYLVMFGLDKQFFVGRCRNVFQAKAAQHPLAKIGQ